MKESELVEFIYILFGVGIVALAYYPRIFFSLLPLVALIGAFYLVWGVASKIIYGFLGIAGERKEDWYNGLAILAIIVLVYNQPTMAIRSVELLLALAWSFVIAILTIPF